MKFLRSLSLALFTALLFGFTSEGLALEKEPAHGPIDIEADSISYDHEADAYEARGQVMITFTQGMLSADSVILQKEANVAIAEGNVRIRTENDALEGDKVVFDLSSNTGVVSSGKMFIARNHFYITGGTIEKKGASDYRIQDVSLTTCDGDAPDWRLTGRELDVTIDGYGTLKGGKFYACDVPLFYVPYLLFPAKTTRQTGFLFPRLGYSRDKLGWDGELPFFLAISQSADATLYQRYMSKRGFKEGMEFRYFLNEDSYGVLYGDYLRDTARIEETTGNLTRDWTSPQDRWSLYFQSYTALQPGLYIRSDIARVSDQWYFKDFSSHNYYLDHYSARGDERFKKISFTADEWLSALNSSIRVVKDWSLYNLTALVKYTDDLSSMSNGGTIQKYPEITLAGVKQSFFGTPVYIDLSAQASENYTAESQKGGLIDFKPAFSLPINVGNTFMLIPEVGASVTAWERDDNLPSADKGGQRTSYRVGTDLTTSLFRDYTLAGKVIEKIRHELKPELTYTYIPYVDQSDLPNFITPLEETNSLAAALTNILTIKTRDAEGVTHYQEVLRLKLAESYDINEARKDEDESGSSSGHFGAIDVELDITPVQYIAFFLRNRFDVNTGVWDKTNYDLAVSDDRGDSAKISYRYTRDLLQEINLSLRAVLTASLSISYALKRNGFDGENVDNTFTFTYQRQCWSIGLRYSATTEDRSLALMFSLNGLGGVGQAQPGNPWAGAGPVPLAHASRH